jgi:pimeloyl-ACP methyl ester carboxylesterase
VKRAGLLIAAALAFFAVGCSQITARDAYVRNAIRDHWERVQATSPDLSETTCAVLAGHGLLEEALVDPECAARELEPRIGAEPNTEGMVALAELSYQTGLRHQTFDPFGAIAWYRDAATLASLALADPGATQLAGAVRIHNQALTRLIRVAQSSRVRGGRMWRDVLVEYGFVIDGSSHFLDPTRIADLRLTGDLRVTGMNHVYHTNGLGVPVVAHRIVDPANSADAQDQFLPRELRAAATAVVVAEGGFAGGEWRRGPTRLHLIDPFEADIVTVGDRPVRIASDRTSPLAMQVARGQLAALQWVGLFSSSFNRVGVDAGLYMLTPYARGKIPVVFVHGLFSSPEAWVQTINELRNSPELAGRYQFWMFMYPTGEPIPRSALQLRESLARVRDSFDPEHTDQALDQMVVVGHSMGGVLAKTTVQNTGLELWNAVINVPHDQFKAPEDLRRQLDKVLIFEPVPFVRRVVFIATPHRGSPMADSLFGRAVSGLVSRPADLEERIREIEALNGPGVVSQELRNRELNSIANLKTTSPILLALDRIPIDPSVDYHSIIPMINGTMNTDGVVPYRSSRLDGAKSEFILPGTHLSQDDPRVTSELRGILLEHASTPSEAASR